MYKKVSLKKNGCLLAERCRVAEHFWDRLRGLIAYPHLKDGEGMYFPGCNSVHMWGMRFSLDILFLTRKADQYFVSSCCCGVLPWRLLPLWDFQAKDTIELPAGKLAQCDVQNGDEVCIS